MSLLLCLRQTRAIEKPLCPSCGVLLRLPLVILLLAFYTGENCMLEFQRTEGACDYCGYERDSIDLRLGVERSAMSASSLPSAALAVQVKHI